MPTAIKGSRDAFRPPFKEAPAAGEGRGTRSDPVEEGEMRAPSKRRPRTRDIQSDPSHGSGNGHRTEAPKSCEVAQTWGFAHEVDTFQQGITRDTCGSAQNRIGELEKKLLNWSTTALTEDDSKAFDTAGVLLWNRAVLLDCVEGVSDDDVVKVVVARCRQLAFACFQLAYPQKADDVDLSIRLLDISAKTALALFKINDRHSGAQALKKGRAYIDKIQSHLQHPLAIEARATYSIARAEQASKTNTEEEARRLCEALEIGSTLRKTTVAFEDATCKVMAFAERRIKEGRDSQDQLVKEKAFHEVVAILARFEDFKKVCVSSSNPSFKAFTIASKNLSLQARFELTQLGDTQQPFQEIADGLRELASLLQGPERRIVPLILIQLLGCNTCSDEELTRAWQMLLEDTQLNDDTVASIRKGLAPLMNRLDDNRYDITVEALSALTLNVIEDRAHFSSWSTSIGLLWLPVIVRMEARNAAMISKMFDELLRLGEIEFSQDIALALQFALSDVAARVGSKDSLDAVPIFELAAHRVFYCVQANAAVFRRRAAQCFIESGLYGEAFSQMAKCPDQESPLTKLLFLWIYAEQNKDKEAVSTLVDLKEGGDVPRHWLVWILNLADRKGLSGLKEGAASLLLQDPGYQLPLIKRVEQTRGALQILYQRARAGSPWQSVHRKVVLLINVLLSHFTEINDKERSDEKLSLELDWLYKSSYNMAIDMAIDMSTNERLALNSCVLDSLNCRLQLAIEPDAEFYRVRLWAGINILNLWAYADGKSNENDLHVTLDLCRRCYDFLDAAKKVSSARFDLDKVDAILKLQEIDNLLQLKDWDDLERTVQSAEGFDLSALCAFTETIYNSDVECPFSVCCTAVKAVLRKVARDATREGIADPEPVQTWTRMLLHRMLQGPMTLAHEQAMAAIFAQYAVPLLTETTKFTFVPAKDLNELKWLQTKVWTWMLDAVARSKPVFAENLKDIALAFANVDGSNMAPVRRAQWNNIQTQMRSIYQTQVTRHDSTPRM